jgi:putative flippase GtrA
MSHVVIITVYKEDEHTVELCSKLTELGAENIVVVNDGCKQGESFFNELVSIGCHVVDVDEQKGKGASIKVGAEYAYKNLYDISGFITADADGQHKAEDIMRVSRALELRPDNLILGRRDLKKSKLKLRQRLGNKISSLYFRIITGVSCKDTLTGLRGIPATLYDIIVNTNGNRFDYEMNFLTKCADLKVPFYNVNIVTDITLETESSYRLIRDTYLIYRTPLRFATASIGCTLVDLTLFTVIAYLLPSSMQWNVALATLLARIVSGSINFLINRKMIFQNDGKARSQALKFLILFICIMCASTIIVSLLSFLPIPVTLIKAIVDLLLWTVNYTVQRKWVFKEE